MEEFEIGFRLTLRRQVCGWFEDGQLGIDLTAELHDGRYLCTQLDVTPLSGGPPGVSGESLRELKIAEMIESAARHPDIEEQIATRGRSVVEDSDAPTEVAAEAVAAAYRYGHAVGDRPTREVIQLLGLSRSGAGRWIAVCREQGLLASTREREAGGVVLAEDALQERIFSLRSQSLRIESRIAKLERREAQDSEIATRGGGDRRAHRSGRTFEELRAKEHRRLGQIRGKILDAEEKLKDSEILRGKN